MTQRRGRYSRQQVLRAGMAALGGLSVGGPAVLRGSLAGAASQPGAGRSGESALSTALLGFGLRLHAQLAAQAPNTNVLISPSSVGIALAMTYNGARGTTASAMATALGLSGLTLDQVNAASAAWRASLGRLDRHVQVSVADGLWVRRNLTLVPAFAQRNQQFYGARVAAVDFSNPATRAAINAWVSQQTHGKIASIIDHPIDPVTALYLVNALYFKGRWATPFDKAATRDGAFTGPNGQRTLPMMSRGGSFAYYRGPGFQAVGLPYGAGRLRMYVFLPDAGSDLNTFRRGLSAQAWRNWLRRFASAQGKLALPRFTLEFGAALNGTLAALGMGLAFDPNRADFTGMVTNNNVFISEVVHKTYMQVDEEGTTAAGSTAVGMQPTLALLPQFTMIVNRPFFCVIHDQLTGMPLFMGSIVAPA